MKHEKYYVIPDIHGMNSMLQKALTHIYEEELDGGKIIFLGDYIDRGPDSFGVMKTVMNPPDNWEFVCLRGNHEEMFIDAHNMLHEFYDPRVLKSWPERPNVKEWVEWMSKLPYFHIEGNNVFAHAFYDGHKSPEEQIEQDCIWTRYGDAQAFFSKDGKFLTHGHTPRINGPITSPDRINMDCGAPFKGGRLVCGIYYNNIKGPVDFLEFTA